jgi:hypothetical protein
MLDSMKDAVRHVVKQFGYTVTKDYKVRYLAWVLESQRH